jgi:hypothetical protein
MLDTLKTPPQEQASLYSAAVTLANIASFITPVGEEALFGKIAVRS